MGAASCLVPRSRTQPAPQPVDTDSRGPPPRANRRRGSWTCTFVCGELSDVKQIHGSIRVLSELVRSRNFTPETSPRQKCRQEHPRARLAKCGQKGASFNNYRRGEAHNNNWLNRHFAENVQNRLSGHYVVGTAGRQRGARPRTSLPPSHNRSTLTHGGPRPVPNRLTERFCSVNVLRERN